jgi:hypothetical protein
MKGRSSNSRKEENMKSRERTIKSLINLGALAVLLAAAPGLRADGFIIPSPRPEIGRAHV